MEDFAACSHEADVVVHKRLDADHVGVFGADGFHLLYLLLIDDKRHDSGPGHGSGARHLLPVMHGGQHNLFYGIDTPQRFDVDVEEPRFRLEIDAPLGNGR